MKGEITKKQAEWQKLVAQGVDAVEAARRAGYANPKLMAQRNQALFGNANSDVLRFWARVMNDEEINIRERIKASELYLKALEPPLDGGGAGEDGRKVVVVIMGEEKL